MHKIIASPLLTTSTAIIRTWIWIEEFGVVYITGYPINLRHVYIRWVALEYSGKCYKSHSHKICPSGRNIM